MKISLNEIKKYVKLPAEISDDEIITRIGSRLVEIEEVVNLAPIYQGIYIAKVEKCEPIPDTHLHLCQINAAKVGRAEKTDAEMANGNSTQLSDANGLVQVVCGAPNVHAGMLTAWISPGSIVPATYGEENFKLDVRKLRGFESHGMLAALDELALGDDHAGIVEIDPKIAAPGDAFAEVFDLNDKILDVENKSLTHRPDCFGIIGFAREVAGIFGQKFIEPEVFAAKAAHPSIISQNSEKVKIKIADSKLCPRYSCAIFDLPSAKPDKFLTKNAIFLAKAGMRAIDPMVDLTNILMLETGQPLHAFDYDKLVAVGGTKTPEIIVRAAEDGEELQLLDGKTLKCSADDILITSNNIPVAMAGAMGGKNTEIDASTKRVVLESATFSLYNLRKTQMAHGIFSEAITRFTKGQPAAMTMPVLAEAVKRLGVAPLALADDYPAEAKPDVVKITTSEINNLLGTNYDTKTICETLENVGFSVEANDGVLVVAAPHWRTDIHLKVDIIEEVGRLLGYDNIPLALPKKPFIEPEIDPMVKLKQELRAILSHRLCLNELLTYSFVSRDLLEKVGLNPQDCYEIVNSISPELQSFRPAIVPSLLDKIRENLKSGHRDFTLYELNQISKKSSGLTAENVPLTKTHLGVVELGDFYALKAKILALFGELKIPVEIRALSPASAAIFPYLEPKRSAEIVLKSSKKDAKNGAKTKTAIAADDAILGAFGEVKLSVAARFKLEQIISALELDLDLVVSAPRATQVALKISKFPSVERDLTVKVASDAPFGQALSAIESALTKRELYFTITPISIYEPESVAKIEKSNAAKPANAAKNPQTKNLSFHLKFSDPARTLNSAEISDIMENITVEMAGIGAEIV